VPISRLAECIAETQKDLAASYLPAPIVGYAGDGNFHVSFVLDPNDSKEMAEAQRLQSTASPSRAVTRRHLAQASTGSAAANSTF
jgi:D-lactate dehydrogenase (cytochrome)